MRVSANQNCNSIIQSFNETHLQKSFYCVCSNRCVHWIVVYNLWIFLLPNDGQNVYVPDQPKMLIANNISDGKKIRRHCTGSCCSQK